MRHGRGLDGRVDLARIADGLRSYDADVIALQELDVGRERSGHTDQPRELGRLLGRHATFFATVDHGPDGHYGHALLTRTAPREVERLPLPRVPLREDRGAIVAQVASPLGELRVIATHLGLLELERRWQLRPLLDRLDQDPGPTLFLGDLNAGPRRGTLRTLRRRLRDTGRASPASTWHAAWPLRRLDYVLASDGLEAVTSQVTTLGQASDHRLLYARLRRR